MTWRQRCHKDGFRMLSYVCMCIYIHMYIHTDYAQLGPVDHRRPSAILMRLQRLCRSKLSLMFSCVLTVATVALVRDTE